MDISEVRKHNTRKDCWVIIHDKAYDVLHFIDEHPGGAAIILKYAGKDATKVFDPVHPGDTLKRYLKEEYHKGPVLKEVKAPKAPPKIEEANSAEPTPSQDAETVDEFDVEYDTQDSKKPIDFGLNDNTVATTAPAAPTPADEDDEYDDDEDDPPTPQELRRRTLARNKPPLASLYNLHDFEYVARHTMEAVAWAYYSLGSDDEITLRENHVGYQRIFFQPRILVDVTHVDYSCEMLGQKLSVPFYVTATALGRLGHPDGEMVLTRAAHDQGVIQMISMLSLCSLDEIADAARDNQPQWLQVYVNRDREITKEILQHAEKRGIKGLFITVDAPQLGRREKDMRSKNVSDEVDTAVQRGQEKDTENGAARAISSFIDTSLNWKDIAWFRLVTKLPIILKGVQTVADSLKAIEHGVEGIVLSNHGGRQLDYSKPGIEVLAELNPILRERGLKDKIEVFVDGGVRRATDILKAICLGAKGVGIGRPFLYAMSTYGDDGVYKAMQILKDELEMNMRLLGVTRLDQLDESFIDFRNVGGTRLVSEDKLFGGNYETMTRPDFGVKL